MNIRISLLTIITAIFLSSGCSKPTMEKPVSLEPSVSEQNGQLLIKAKTNLPGDTKLIITLTDKSENIVFGKSVASVTGEGLLSFDPLGPAEGLKVGNYVMRIKSSDSQNQPGKVLDFIGEKGEYLTGDLVEKRENGVNFVNVSYPIELFKK